MLIVFSLFLLNLFFLGLMKTSRSAHVSEWPGYLLTYAFTSGNLTFSSEDRDSLSDILITNLCLEHTYTLLSIIDSPPVSKIFSLHTHTLLSNSFSRAHTHTHLCNSHYFVIFRILWGHGNLLFPIPLGLLVDFPQFNP